MQTPKLLPPTPAHYTATASQVSGTVARAFRSPFTLQAHPGRAMIIGPDVKPVTRFFILSLRGSQAEDDRELSQTGKGRYRGTVLHALPTDPILQPG